MAKKAVKNVLKSWYYNRYQLTVLQRNALLIITILAMLAVCSSMFVIAKLNASRSIEPYVIEIEDKSGIPVLIEQKTKENFTEDEMMKRYFIVLFIQSLEGYDPYTYRMDYNRVRLFSSAQVFRDAYFRISERADDSPVKRLGNRGRLLVGIKSIQFLESNYVQVRFRVTADGVGEPPKDYVSYMTYRFVNLELTVQERFINPLGFQVTFYRVTEEYAVQ